MRRVRRILHLAVVLAVVALVSILATPVGATRAPDVEAEAAKARARVRALIASEGRPAFRMSATLSVLSGDGKERIPCAYEIRWLNVRNWQETISAGAMRVVATVRDGKRTNEANADATSAGVHRIRRLMLSPAVRPVLAPAYALKRVRAGTGATCFEEKWFELEARTCVDEVSGAVRNWQIGTEVYAFQEAAPFHDAAVPRARRTARRTRSRRARARRPAWSRTSRSSCGSRSRPTT